MKARTQSIDDALFKGFTPLNTFDRHTLEKLARHATIRRITAGNFLFERGDTESQTLFLLDGEIELSSPVSPTQKVTAGAEVGRYPLAHSFPRQLTARAITNVRVLVLPLDILEVMPADAAKGKSSDDRAAGNAWKTRWLNSPMLRKLPAKNKEALLSKLEEIKVQAGQVIIHQDEPADSYFVIKMGRCSVSRRPAPGTRDVKLAELSEGQGFGEEALITNVVRNASVTMLDNGVLLRLSKQDFITLLARPLLHQLPFQKAIELVEQGAVLIDVRAPEEFEIDGLIGSLNMPIPVLRLKVNRLNRDSTYIIYSNTGNVSSVAAFLLIQQGLKAYVLQGGLSTAPEYRMKRGAYNENDTASHDDAAPSKKVLSFPHDNDAQHNSGINPRHNDKNPGDHNTEVDWNLISDDVLWKTTIGHRQDASVEAAMSANAVRDVQQAPPVDTTLQGFDDIRLFTTVHPVKEMGIGEVPETQTVSGFSQLEDSPAQRRPKMRPQYHSAPGPWANKPYQRPSRRWIIASLAILLVVCGGFAFLYFSPSKLNEASPLLLEQQRKLDAKVSRLLDALESMPPLKKHADETDVPTGSTTPVAPATNNKSDPQANASEGQILRQ